MRRVTNDFLFLLSGPAAAAAWFALLLTGWLAAALLAITPAVVPVLLALRWSTRRFALGEAAVARELLGVDAHVPPTAPGRPGYTNRIRSVLADGAFWRQQAYGWLRVTVGFATGIAAAAAVGSSVFVIVLPLTYRWVDMWQVHTLGRAFAAVPVGVAALVVSGALVHALAQGWEVLASRLLSPVPSASGPRRGGLRAHVAFYLVVNAIVLVVWAPIGGYFWPEWPLLALAIPLAVHGIALTRRRAIVLHASILGVLAVFLIAVWAVTTRAYFWPAWPILAFALLVGIHAFVESRHSGLEERIDVLETTRAGAVDAAETELRRIERDLHDGAQARLVAVGMSLGLAQQRLDEDPDAARRLLEEARAGAEEALRELRDLARGIHPPVLTDRGLEPALAALVARSPLPVHVDVDLPERPPAVQESTAYFIAAEALANATKHGAASRIAIAINRRNGDLVVRVEDDGRGGADATGRGLVGLARRVEALDGTIQLSSPAGGPTVVEAVIPCAS